MAAQYAFDVYPAATPLGTKLVRLSVGGSAHAGNLVSGEFTAQLYGLGAGSLSIHTSHADATETNLAQRNYVVVRRIDTDPEQDVFAFFLEEGEFDALSRRETGGRILTFGGPGALAILDRAVLHEDVYAPGQPCRGSCPNVPGIWRWAAGLSDPIAYGGILVRAIEEGQEQPQAPLADVTLTFDRVNDSASSAWAEIDGDWTKPVGTKVLDLYADFLRLGLVAQMSPGLVLSAYDSVDDFATDRTSASFAAGKVRFEAGVNIAADLTKKIDPSLARSEVVVASQTDSSIFAVVTTGGSGVPYSDTISVPTNDTLTLQRAGEFFLAQRAKMTTSATFPHIIGDDAANGLYAPGPDGDYWVGDLVTLHTGSAEHDFDEFAIEVAAIRFHHDAAGNWFASPQLGAQYIDPRLARLEQHIVNEVRQGQAHSHPELLCMATVPPSDEVFEATRLYPTGNSGGISPAFDDLWDAAASAVRLALSTTPGVTGSDLGVSPWSQAPASGPVDARLVQWQWALPGTGTLQGWLRGFAEVQSRWGVGINESAQNLIGQAVVKVVSSDGSTVRGVAYAGHDLGSAGSNKKWPPSAEQPGNGPPRSRSLIPLSEYDSALGVALTPVEWQSGDVLVIEQGVRSFMTSGNGTGAGIHVHITAGSDMPETEDLTDDLRMWYEITTLTAAEGTSGVVGAGHPDLVGTSTRAKRCDSKDHVNRLVAPTPVDDLAHGYPAGTLWHVLDDLDNPTALLATYISLQHDNGAAIWVPYAPSATQQTAADTPYDNTGSGLDADNVQDALDAVAAAVVSTVVSHGSMGSTEEFDAADGHDHEGTLDDDLTITLTGATNGEAAFMTLKLNQDGTGGHSLTLPSSVVTKDATEAAFDDEPNAVNILTLFTYDGGTTWYAFLAGGSAGGASATAWVVDPGTPGYSGSGPVTVALTSKFGIDSSGNPYYNAANVTDGEEAALVWDSVTGTYSLRPYYP